jgi:hypothetical protein
MGVEIIVGLASYALHPGLGLFSRDLELIVGKLGGSE